MNRHLRRLTTGAAVYGAALCAGLAQAQTVGIGVTRGGGLNQVGVGVASIVSKHAEGVQMRPQPMTGTDQYTTLVNAGEIDFGLANAFQSYFAYTGTVLSEGKKHENLRLVATLVPLEAGYFVRNDSDIQSYADLKGKKVGYGFTGAPVIQHFATSFLGHVGLTWKDVQPVPVATLGQQWDLLRQGTIDVATAPAGSPPVRELDTTVPGGVRFLSLDASPEAVARLQKSMPFTYLSKHTPEGKLPGVREPVNVLGFDMLLYAHKDVPEKTVYRVIKAINENYEELAATSPMWRRYDKKNIARGQAMPFHPGADRYFREAGLLK